MEMNFFLIMGKKFLSSFQWKKKNKRVKKNDPQGWLFSLFLNYLFPFWSFKNIILKIF